MTPKCPDPSSSSSLSESELQAWPQALSCGILAMIFAIKDSSVVELMKLFVSWEGSQGTLSPQKEKNQEDPHSPVLFKPHLFAFVFSLLCALCSLLYCNFRVALKLICHVHICVCIFFLIFSIFKPKINSNEKSEKRVISHACVSTYPLNIHQFKTWVFFFVLVWTSF